MDCDALKENGTMLTPARRTDGFSLIELLVVIAIIAILAAIIFPVFFTVREKARQGTVMGDFRQINGALARYKLDHHSYPDVLFGYAPANPTTQPMSQTHTLGALYPTYINDVSVFTDPNDTAKPTDTQSVDVNVLCPGTDPACTGVPAGTLVKASAQKTFYTADAYDIGPAIGANGALAAPLTYLPRYQKAWTSFPPPAALAAYAQRELAVPNPDGNTYVTCTTYHVPQGKVLVLFQDGAAKTLDVSRFLNGTTDPANIDAAAATPGSASAAQFWEVTP